MQPPSDEPGASGCAPTPVRSDTFVTIPGPTGHASHTGQPYPNPSRHRRTCCGTSITTRDLRYRPVVARPLALQVETVGDWKDSP
jgi:hypothetical protein